MIPVDVDTPTLPADQEIDLEAVGRLEAELDSAPEGQRAALARSILRIDPEHIDAFLVLAARAPTRAEAMSHLREAVRIGNRRWAPVIESGAEVDWWRDPETRPYMRAILAYGDALAVFGRQDVAVECYEALTDMQPLDGDRPRLALEEMEMPWAMRR